MKSSYACVGLIILTLLGSIVAMAKPKAPPDVLVVADAQATDPSIQLRPEPGKPIYYFILGKMARDLGTRTAGIKEPDAEKLHVELAKSLASQGYLETKIGGPSPQIVLLVTWGEANLATDDFTDTETTTDATTGESSSVQVTSTVDYNRKEMDQLVGANKVDSRKMSTNDWDVLQDALRSERLYVTVSALDAEALRKKEKKLLWRTRMSIDGLHEEMPDNLGVMFASAAPYFGRNMDHTVIVDEDTRHSTVKLGDLQFIDDKPAVSKEEPAKK